MESQDEVASMHTQVESWECLIKLKDVTLENEKLKESHFSASFGLSGEEVEKLKKDLKKKDNEIKKFLNDKTKNLNLK